MAAQHPMGQPSASQVALACRARNSGQAQLLDNEAGQVYAHRCKDGRQLARISLAAALVDQSPGFHALPPPASTRGWPALCSAHLPSSSLPPAWKLYTNIVCLCLVSSMMLNVCLDVGMEIHWRLPLINTGMSWGSPHREHGMKDRRRTLCPCFSKVQVEERNKLLGSLWTQESPCPSGAPSGWTGLWLTYMEIHKMKCYLWKSYLSQANLLLHNGTKVLLYLKE